MGNFKGLFVEDEISNIAIYTKLFRFEGLDLEYVNPLPDSVEQYNEIVFNHGIDFLVIDYHLEKQVDYKGTDVLKEIRKTDTSIYAVLLTNYDIKDFSSELGEYDYEINKEKFNDYYKEIAEKIKRACSLRVENRVLGSIETQHKEESRTIELLKEINSKLDSVKKEVE